MIQLPELFSQRDDRWKSEKLNSCLLTLGTSGCLVSILAALCKFFGKDTNPSKLNKDLVEKGGFNKDGDYTFFGKNGITQPLGISLIYPDIIPTLYVETPNNVTVKQFAEIEAQLNKGFPVLLQVDYIPATSKLDQHWVLLISKENGNWMVYDPWYGDIASLTRYGKPAETIYKYIFYEGKLPKEEAVVDWAAKYAVLDEQFTQFKTEYQPYKDLVEKVSMRLQSAPKEADLMQAIHEYESFEGIADKLWKKCSLLINKELIYPDQIETMLIELDSILNELKTQRETASTPPKTEETPKEVESTTRIELTTLKRILQGLTGIIKSIFSTHSDSE